MGLRCGCLPYELVSVLPIRAFQLLCSASPGGNVGGVALCRHMLPLVWFRHIAYLLGRVSDVDLLAFCFIPYETKHRSAVCPELVAVDLHVTFMCNSSSSIQLSHSCCELQTWHRYGLEWGDPAFTKHQRAVYSAFCILYTDVGAGTITSGTGICKVMQFNTGCLTKAMWLVATWHTEFPKVKYLEASMFPSLLDIIIEGIVPVLLPSTKFL